MKKVIFVLLFISTFFYCDYEVFASNGIDRTGAYIFDSSGSIKFSYNSFYENGSSKVNILHTMDFTSIVPSSSNSVNIIAYCKPTSNSDIYTTCFLIFSKSSFSFNLDKSTSNLDGSGLSTQHYSAVYSNYGYYYNSFNTYQAYKDEINFPYIIYNGDIYTLMRDFYDGKLSGSVISPSMFNPETATDGDLGYFDDLKMEINHNKELDRTVYHLTFNDITTKGFSSADDGFNAEYYLYFDADKNDKSFTSDSYILTDSDLVGDTGFINSIGHVCSLYIDEPSLFNAIKTGTADIHPFASALIGGIGVSAFTSENDLIRLITGATLGGVTSSTIYVNKYIYIRPIDTVNNLYGDWTRVKIKPDGTIDISYGGKSDGGRPGKLTDVDKTSTDNVGVGSGESWGLAHDDAMNNKADKNKETGSIGDDPFSQTQSILGMIGNVPLIIGKLFSFLPAWVLLFVGIGFSLSVVLLIVKIVRG